MQHELIVVPTVVYSPEVRGGGFLLVAEQQAAAMSSSTATRGSRETAIVEIAQATSTSHLKR